MSQKYQAFLVCDGCGKELSAEFKSSVNATYSSMTQLMSEARYKLDWLFKNEGSKGTRHF